MSPPQGTGAGPTAGAGATAGPATVAESVPALWGVVTAQVAAGLRFAGLMATRRQDALLLSVHLAGPGSLVTHEVSLPPGTLSYPALTPVLGAAFWYERQIHDMFGIVPAGHPRLEPLILPLLGDNVPRPQPGSPGQAAAAIWPDEHSLPRHVLGPGMFTIPHGPVRSGVVESVEYLVETPGEDIPHLNMRVFYKHRGVEKRFDGMAVADGVLLAERAEGVASVAHALAYCHAIEEIAGVRVPRPAALVRVLHAELERIASHLEAAVRLADAAGLAVATARFGLHKERVLRLVGQMCGSRFGRGVVVPGGVARLPALTGADLRAAIGSTERAIMADARALMTTASFLDRLRGTGPLTQDRATEHGALGPIGRASGVAGDARRERPYDAYPDLAMTGPHSRADGDALARLGVRWDELRQSCHLIGRAAGELDGMAGQLGRTADESGGAADSPLRSDCPARDGRAVGWAEAPQGEVLYDVRTEGGRITRCHPRSASFHNLVLFHEVFAGDILTDFPFIEASFGLSVAGVAL